MSMALGFYCSKHRSFHGFDTYGLSLSEGDEEEGERARNILRQYCAEGEISNILQNTEDE